MPKLPYDRHKHDEASDCGDPVVGRHGTRMPTGLWQEKGTSVCRYQDGAGPRRPRYRAVKSSPDYCEYDTQTRERKCDPCEPDRALHCVLFRSAHEMTVVAIQRPNSVAKDSNESTCTDTNGVIRSLRSRGPAKAAMKMQATPQPTSRKPGPPSCGCPSHRRQRVRPGRERRQSETLPPRCPREPR